MRLALSCYIISLQLQIRFLGACAELQSVQKSGERGRDLMLGLDLSQQPTCFLSASMELQCV